MDVDAYLRRLNINNRLTPTVESLRTLHVAHLQTVPFENLDIYWGTPLSLNIHDLYEKVVARRRGGFCFELNGLFAWLLRELDFEVTLLGADVADDGVYGVYMDHLTLRVVCPADPLLPAVPWLADVGFGDGFRMPLRLDHLGEDQPQGARRYRIDQDGNWLVLSQQRESVVTLPQYRFTLEPHELADFTPRCLYHQTSPESHFTQKPLCTLATRDGRITLSGNRWIVTTDVTRREREVSEQTFQNLLADRFGISREAHDE